MTDLLGPPWPTPPSARAVRSRAAHRGQIMCSLHGGNRQLTGAPGLDSVRRKFTFGHCPPSHVRGRCHMAARIRRHRTLVTVVLLALSVGSVVVATGATVQAAESPRRG